MGSSGGSSQARTPVEQSDNLKSVAYAQVLDLISEGEIEGLVSGLESVYLNDTPLQNSNGTYNFPGVDVETRLGSQVQDVIPRFTTTSNEIGVGVEVKKFSVGTTPGDVIRRITNTSVTSVRVRISVPALTLQNITTGDLTGTEVRYRIFVSSNGGAYVEKVDDKIIGKSTSKYERSYSIVLSGDPPWDIKVQRTTADATTSNIQNKTFWESYTECVDAKFTYPNSALVGITVDSSQFESIPARSYEIKGVKIKIPSNYDPLTRTYTGIWDGTFQVAWSNNPAWIFYHMLTDERMGLGSYLPEDQIDKWKIYSVGRYCDEYVSDGSGGLEPRFTMNAYLQSRIEAFQLIKDLASAFNAMAYWSEGLLTVTQDAPQDPAYLFTPANVIDGIFSYQGSSLKSRHTVALVTWNDPDDRYSQKIEYVEDSEGIAKYGVVETSITAFGCTSRSQANRLGRWLIYSEKYQTETVNFRTGIGAVALRPGQIIKIQDPVKAGVRMGGRIASATTTRLELDQEATFNPLDSTISVMLPDGSIEDRVISQVEGRFVDLVSSLSEVPLKNAIWIAQDTDIEPQQFRVISITEAKGAVHEITAIAHNPDKYALVEQGVQLEDRNISLLTEAPEAPTGLALTETLYEVNGDVRVKLTVSWNSVPFATSYNVQYQRDSQNLIDLGRTQSNDIEILNAEPGIYQVYVRAINSIGKYSQQSSFTGKIVGKALPPQNVTGFSLVPSAGMAFLSWDKATDLDVLIGGSVRVRYTPLTTGAEWKNTVDITPALAGSSTRATVPLLAGTYMAKFLDSSGNASDDAAAITTTIPEGLTLNVVESITEHTTWGGTFTNMEYNGFYTGILLKAGFSIDEIDDIDAVVNFDYAGGVNPVGYYDFENYLDLGEVFTSKVTTAILADAIDITDTIDQREEYVDDWLDLDGVFIDDVNAELQMMTTEDDPSSMGATWTDWKRFFVSEYKARAFKFRIMATSSRASHNIVIKELSVTVDMPDRVENLRGLTSGTSFYDVSFGAPFWEPPALSITASNMISGDFYEITNKTESGFRITFKNSGGTIVSRIFDVLAKGYGRQV